MRALIKVISGGQTGADQGALEAALILGLKTGGWMPKGWRTDDGPRPYFEKIYNMVEHSSTQYQPRTLSNVMASDATLIFGNASSPGCKLTARYCLRDGKSMFLVPWKSGDQVPFDEAFKEWLIKQNVKVLNVAGNRERTNRNIFAATKEFLIGALK